MRSVHFEVGELYHVYNRGVDKRSIFLNKKDFERFVFGVKVFNQVDLLQSVAFQFRNEDFFRYEDLTIGSSPLVRIHTYCFNQNHFHMIVEPLVDGGVSRFMHRLSTSYTNYFNKRHDRSGSLFQGPYKAIHIVSNEYFMHLGCYVTLNQKMHPSLNKPWLLALPFSALGEYKDIENSNKIAYTKLLLAQYKNRQDFLKTAKETVAYVANLRDQVRRYAQMCID